MEQTRIVILDGEVTNPGDLSWSSIECLGRTVVYDRTPVDQIVSRATEAEVVFTNDVPMDRTILMQLPKLQYIGVLATGYNHVDVKAAAELGVFVSNVPDYCTSAVAQAAMALLLELCYHAGDHSQSVHAGDWSRAKDYCYWNFPLIELSGKTLGIIGYGRIGKKVALIAEALGMDVIVAESLRYEESSTTPELGNRVALDDLFQAADVVSLHCPLSNSTRQLINAKKLSLMKPSAFLINVSRGALVKDADLAAALNEGQIAGAGLDVLSTEPPANDNPLLTARNCIITPHIAWAPVEARSRLVEIAAANLEAYLRGQPINGVS
jgi:glycerate dehydrogenase